jgi:hypothetical protein
VKFSLVTSVKRGNFNFFWKYYLVKMCQDITLDFDMKLAFWKSVNMYSLFGSFDDAEQIVQSLRKVVREGMACQLPSS